MSVQEKLSELQPYVTGIRTFEGIQVVEVVFEKNWSLVKDDNFKIAPDDENPNHLFFLPNSSEVDVDDTLEYVKRIIDYNIEQQKKHELLKKKVEELKEVFKANSYEDLKEMEFKIGKDEQFDDLVGDQSELTDDEVIQTDDIQLDDEQKVGDVPSNGNTEGEGNVEKKPKKEGNNKQRPSKKKRPSKKNKENGQQAPQKQEPKQESNEKPKEDVKETQQHKTQKVPGGKVDLPSNDQELDQAAANGKVELEDYTPKGECDHGPDETCPNCVDNVDL